MTVGEKLRQCRLNCCLTQKQVADALNIDRATYSYYELERTEPSLDTMAKLASIFNVEYFDLLPSVKNVTVHDYGIQKTVRIEQIYDLEDDEQNIILKYRLMDDKQRERFLEEMAKISDNQQK